jgi:tRNA threonylcarbamoyl adenosine modification protein YeaZ
MRILGIDSSCSAATVAMLNDGILEMEIYINHKLQHSVMLFPMIEDMLKELEITVDDIDAVAVSGGPGSFTGLRIGVASAKGIAQGGSKDFIGISSLDAMAFQQLGFEGIICPIMDALRDNVYTAMYKGTPSGEPERLGDYMALHIDELLEQLLSGDEKVIFCGDALHIHAERIRKKLGDKAFFAPSNSSMPRASSIAELAAYRLSRGEKDDIHTFSPIYLRKSQAEREYDKKHGGSCE